MRLETDHKVNLEAYGQTAGRKWEEGSTHTAQICLFTMKRASHCTNLHV